MDHTPLSLSYIRPVLIKVLDPTVGAAPAVRLCSAAMAKVRAVPKSVAFRVLLKNSSVLDSNTCRKFYADPDQDPGQKLKFV